MFTSIHIDEYSLDVRETKLGAEELTPDIPNVSEEATKDLDENGMIRIGANILPGDILVGKITPKGESDPSPEEKLLRAIFGDKAGDVKDASLKAPPSLKGTIIDKKLFQKSIKTKKQRLEDKTLLTDLENVYDEKFNNLKSQLIEKLSSVLNGKTSLEVKNLDDEIVIAKGKKITLKLLNSINDFYLVEPFGWVNDKDVDKIVGKIILNYNKKFAKLNSSFNREKYKIKVGDELPSGVLKSARVYVAKKKNLKLVTKWLVDMVTKVLLLK